MAMVKMIDDDDSYDGESSDNDCKHNKNNDY